MNGFRPPPICFATVPPSSTRIIKYTVPADTISHGPELIHTLPLVFGARPNGSVVNSRTRRRVYGGIDPARARLSKITRRPATCPSWSSLRTSARNRVYPVRSFLCGRPVGLRRVSWFVFRVRWAVNSVGVFEFWRWANLDQIIDSCSNNFAAARSYSSRTVSGLRILVSRQSYFTWRLLVRLRRVFASGIVSLRTTCETLSWQSDRIASLRSSTTVFVHTCAAVDSAFIRLMFLWFLFFHTATRQTWRKIHLYVKIYIMSQPRFQC